MYAELLVKAVKVSPSKALSSLQGFMEGYTQGLESSSDTKQQEQGKIFRQALMLLASPNGIALTTPENIILQASQDIAESASGSINLSAQKILLGTHKTKLVCLPRKRFACLCSKRKARTASTR